MGMIYAPPSIIPNGPLINDVCHIYQSTKPTTRPDGRALMVSDKWYNTNTGVEGFWNGTYWLSSLVTHLSSFSIAGLTASGQIIAHWGNMSSSLDGSRIITTPFKAKPIGTPYSIFFDSISWFGNINPAGTIDASNYWGLSWQINSRRNNPIESIVTNFLIPQGTYEGYNVFEVIKTNIAYTFDNKTGGGDFVNGYCVKVGNPPGLANQTLRGTFREIL